MATLRLSSLSLEYIRVPVSAKSGGVAIDPTSDVVQMAFMPIGSAPTSGDWKTASWESDSTTTTPTYYARCLVGPGGTATLAGSSTPYGVWVKVSDSPEVPVRLAGELMVV